MPGKKKFTISIGEYGIIVAMHNGNNIQNKILVAALNYENQPQLTELFTKNKSVPIYLLVDTTNQNYKKKSYPSTNEFDLRKIVKRDMEKELGEQEQSFQNYYYTKDKAQKKWDCIFVSVAKSAEIDKWVEFLLGMPNEFVGIYMLPIETYNLAAAIFEIAKTEHNLGSGENRALSFIVQNKVSGVRQIIFYNRTIIFTRVVNYDFADRNFISKFEQDIFRANEYLKMILPNLKTQDVVIINMLSEEIIEIIKNTANHDLKFINYSPYQVSEKLGLKNVITKNNANFSDLLIANYFASGKKTLKFSDERITFLSRLSLVIKSARILNFLIFAAALLTCSKIFINQYEYNQSISDLKNNRNQLEEQFQNISNAALDLDNTSGLKAEEQNNLADKIIDFGKVDEALSKINFNVVGVFDQLTFIKKYGAIADSFSYQIPNFSPKGNSLSTSGKLFIVGTLSDPSGDIEVLFKKFDTLALDTKNKLPKYNIKYSELSKNVDFSKKYYSFPFDLTIENKAGGANQNVGQ